MKPTKIENRMTELEQEMAVLRKKVDELSGSNPWWERIAGTFRNDPIYKQAMKLGKQYRQAQKPTGSPPQEK